MSYKQALQENNIDLQSLLDAVNELPDQVSLPTLSNPASPSEILSGYEAIGEDGSVVEGEALATASTATAADIMSGKTAYNSAGELLTGTASAGYKLKTGSLTSMDASSTTKTVSVSGTIYLVVISTTSNFTTSAYTNNILYIKMVIDRANTKGYFPAQGLSKASATFSDSTLTAQGQSGAPATWYYKIFYT